MRFLRSHGSVEVFEKVSWEDRNFGRTMATDERDLAWPPEAVRARLAAGHDAAAAGASRDKPAAECIADRGTMALN